MIGITSVASCLLVWIALAFRADMNEQLKDVRAEVSETNSKVDETNERLSALEIGQATMTVKIDNNTALKASVEDIRRQVREIEREMLLRNKNGPAQ